MGIPNSWSEQWKATEDSKTLSQLERPLQLPAEVDMMRDRVVIPIEEFTGRSPLNPKTEEYNTTILEFYVPSGMGQWFYQRLHNNPDQLNRLMKRLLENPKTQDSTMAYDTAWGNEKKAIGHFGGPVYRNLEGEGFVGNERRIRLSTEDMILPDFFGEGSWGAPRSPTGPGISIPLFNPRLR